MSCNCHNCSHSHEEHTKKILIFRLIIGGLLFVTALLTDSRILIFTSYIILGYDVLLEAVKDLKHIFNENFLMTIATIGAFIIGEYAEAVAVMLFYQIGESLSRHAVDKSEKSIEALMDMRLDTATVLKEGKHIKTNCNEINIGDIIVVSPGERVALDGKIIKGSAYFDTSSLTGESKHKFFKENDKIMSGIINTNSTVHIKVESTLSQSTVSKILELVKTDNKSKSEKFITKFAKIYTPIVVFLAAVITILPPLLGGNIKDWFHTAMLFLVVSCPCALVVSVPLTFFAGIGCASKKGILIKGGYAVESLSNIKNIAFDKTGTLTEGSFTVTEIISEIDENELLKYAAYAEFYSPHPIAKAIISRYDNDIEENRISNYEEITGYGACANVDGNQVLIGSKEFLEKNNVFFKYSKENTVFVAINRRYAGCIVVDDNIKTNAEETFSMLKNMKISPVILTGDTKENSLSIAKSLNTPLYSSLLPDEKVDCIKKLQKSGLSAFVGDGINDAPVLSNADVGISMGLIGTDAAIEASDIVIMGDELIKIPLAVRISRKTMLITKENILFALFIKFSIMLFSLLGFTSMWLAVFADVGVCLFAVLNSLRALKIDKSI